MASPAMRQSAAEPRRTQTAEIFFGGARGVAPASPLRLAPGVGERPKAAFQLPGGLPPGKNYSSITAT